MCKSLLKQLDTGFLNPNTTIHRINNRVITQKAPPSQFRFWLQYFALCDPSMILRIPATMVPLLDLRIGLVLLVREMMSVGGKFCVISRRNLLCVASAFSKLINFQFRSQHCKKNYIIALVQNLRCPIGT